MKKYFLTGGMGFIGRNLTTTLLKQIDDCEITIYDNLYRHPKNFQANLDTKRVRFVNADLFDQETLFSAAQGHHYAIHLAALAGVDSVIKDPAHTMKTNIQGTLAVLEAIAQPGSACEHFINFSTSEIFGSYAYKVSENDLMHAGNIAEARWSYAVSKIAGEYLVRSYSKEYKFAFSSIRPFNIYGPGQIGEGAIHTFIRRALKNEPLVIRGGGNQIRSWCYIDDIVQPLVNIIGNKAAFNEDFNIGNPQSTLTIFYLAKLIKDLLKSDSEIVFDNNEYTDVNLRVPDISKLQDILGYSPSTSLEEGILKTAEWYRQN